MNRNQSLHRLRTEWFDVCVLGGGATGTGCALDAQLRGLQTALIEKEDFSAETSSKSTKLVHGGVRYLEQAVKKLDWEQFRLVQKALKERRTVLNNAPYLAHPLALLTPCYNWWESWYYSIGLRMYDWIAGSTNLFPSQRLSKREALQYMPSLHAGGRLHSAVLYWDGQLNDARYNVLLAKTASDAGAAVANHLRAVDFEKDEAGKLRAVLVEDQLSGERFMIRAGVFVNATGPWADSLRQMANPQLSSRIRVSKGAHIVLPRSFMPGDTALLIPQTEDGRVIFAIPWQGALLVGTTDTETSLSAGEPQLQADEVMYLLDYLNRYLSSTAGPAQVQSGFAGLRPLLQAAGGGDTKELVRDHEVEQDAISGLVSIMGGKWTTYRLMAQDTIDAVCATLGRASLTSRTAHHPLSGAQEYSPRGWENLQEQSGWSEELCETFWGRYGTHAWTLRELVAENAGWNAPLVENASYLLVEVIYAVRHEMALTLRDVLARRFGLELVSWEMAMQAAAPTARLMASELGWSEARTKEEIERYTDRIARLRATAIGKVMKNKQSVG